MDDITPSKLTEWTRALNRSDQSGGAELFRAMYPRLLRYAKRLTGSDATAEDVVQEAFLRLWKMRATLDPGRSIKSLLYVMVRNLALNVPKRAHDELGTDMEGPSMSPLEDMQTEMLADHIRTWIDALPTRRQEAFHLSRFEDLSYAEIAQVMDVSVRTVENHIRLALQHLRDRLREYEPSLLER